MIGKVVMGKSFKGCLLYCLNDKKQEANNEHIMKDRAEVLMYNKCFGNAKELVQQFDEVRQLNRKLMKPVLHITLSLAPGENLGKDKLMEMCEQCAKDMGFESNQFIAVSHRDTHHQHLHIVANRIGLDARTVSDSNNYQKIANYCRKMEQKYGLTQVLNPRKYLPKEQRNIPRLDTRKEQMKQDIKEALKGCFYYEQFERKMEEKGYEIIKGRGISFADEKKVKVKGSELNYSLQTIEKILEIQRGLQGVKQRDASMLQINKQVPTTTEITNEKDDAEGLSKTLEYLMKPQENDEQIDQNLKHQNQKKKRRRSHRL